LTRKTFKGGVHPPDNKASSRGAAIEDAPVPDLVVVTMGQHLGAPAKPVVAVGDGVKRGQVIGEAAGFISSNVHSPVSGRVVRVEPAPHPLGKPVTAVAIENDRADAAVDGYGLPVRWEGMSAGEICAKILAMGVVGMGGATFPTHVKLAPPKDRPPIDTVVINGAECEPYLTSDFRLMVENPGGIVEGLRIILKATGAPRALVGIEANKPEAIEALARAASGLSGVSVEEVPVRYPQGGEKQLIKTLLGREVPSGGLPLDVGVVVQNVGTACAIADAVAWGRPLTDRIVTVAGAVERPANYRTRIGVPAGALLERSNLKPSARKIIFGGPMMGLAQYTSEVAVTKSTSGILALDEVDSSPARGCIRCGKCVEGCPSGLVPSMLSVLGEAGRFIQMGEWDAADCIECGVCAYVCPAKRPIVHYIKRGKEALRQARAKGAAK